MQPPGQNQSASGFGPACEIIVHSVKITLGFNYNFSLKVTCHLSILVLFYYKEAETIYTIILLVKAKSH